MSCVCVCECLCSNGVKNLNHGRFNLVVSIAFSYKWMIIAIYTFYFLYIGFVSMCTSLGMRFSIVIIVCDDQEPWFRQIRKGCTFILLIENTPIYMYAVNRNECVYRAWSCFHIIFKHNKFNSFRSLFLSFSAVTVKVVYI